MKLIVGKYTSKPALLLPRSRTEYPEIFLAQLIHRGRISMPDTAP